MDILIKIFGLLIYFGIVLVVAGLLILLEKLVRKLLKKKKDFSKRDIVGYIIFSCLVPFLAIIGFSDHSHSPKAMIIESMSLTYQYRTPLAEWHEKNGNFKNVKIADIGGTTHGEWVENIWFSIPENADDHTIVIYAKLKSGGKIFTLETQDGGITWACGFKAKYNHANSVDKKYMPDVCK